MLVTLRRKGGNLFVPKSDWHLISPYNITPGHTFKSQE